MSFKRLTYSTISKVSKELEYWLRSNGATHTTRPVMKKRKVRKRNKDDNPNKMYVVASFKTMDEKK